MRRRQPQPVRPIEALERRVLLAGQIYVADASTGSIGAYTTAGQTVNPALVTGLSFGGPYGDIAVDGQYLFVVSYSSGTVGEYTTAGATVNANLITGLGVGAFGMFYDAGALYIAFGNGGSTTPDGHVASYTLGTTPGTIASSAPNLITGLSDVDSLAVTGSTIYVSDYALGTIGAYSTAGATINASLVSGLQSPESIVLVGSDLFVTEQGSGQRIGEYATTGAAVNANLVPGLDGPYILGSDGQDLFVIVGGGTVAEYTTAGTLVNPALLTGLGSAFGLVVTPAAAAPAGQLAVASQPTAGTATAPLAGVVVDVEDGSGAVVTTDASTVTLTVATGPAGGVLSGTTTATAVAGVATFGNFTVSLPGTYTLAATAGALAVTTAPFSVTAPVIKTVGGLDPTFGTGGLASHDVGFTATTGVAADGAGSVLVGPVGSAPNQAFGLTRYTADGSLDATFGTGGVVTTAFAGAGAVPQAVAVLADGNIVVAGTATTYAADGVTPTGSAFAVAEYTAAGALDAPFGTGGETVLRFGSGAAATNDVLHALAVGPGGVIYLGGSTDAAGTPDLAVARLTAAGGLDPVFGTGGRVAVDVAGGADAVYGLAVQADGAVVAAGSAEVGGVTEVAVARLLTGGQLDKRFGTKGVVTSKVGGVFDAARAVAVTAADQIVVGGLSATGVGTSLSSDFLLQRYTRAGRPDRSFGTAGTAVTPFGQPAAVTQVLVQADGTVVASGRTAATLGGAAELAVARYTSRGTLDKAFGGTGTVTVDLTGGAAAPAVLLAAAAADLGAAFDAFTSSSQGVVAETAGGEILSAGSSGADTVEAELVAAGVDLAVKLLSALPASVLAGARGTATVTLTEAGTERATGPVTITVEFAADAAGTGAVDARMLAARVNLGQGQSRTYKVAFAYPTGLADGAYYMLAGVSGAAPISADLNGTNNAAASGAAVTVAPAYVALSGSALSAASALTRGASATIAITIANGGNVMARGGTTVAVYLSTDGTLAAAVPAGSAALAVGLPAGKSRAYRLRVALPASVAAGSYTLLAVVDPGRTLGATDRTDATAVVAGAVPVTVR